MKINSWNLQNFFLNKLLKFLKEDLIDAAEEIRLKEIEEEENTEIYKRCI